MKEFVPKIFDVMKTYSKGQLVKDVVAGIIVAIIALPLSIALALASGVSPEQGNIFSWRKQGADSRSYSCICNNSGRYSSQKWYGRINNSHNYGWYYTGSYGIFKVW